MKIKRKTLDLIKKWLIGGGVTFLISICMYVYFGTSLFTVTTYQFFGVPATYLEPLTKHVNEALTGKYIWLFPRNKIATRSNTRIREAVFTVLPNTKSVSIRARGLHTIAITVEPFVPLFRIDDKEAITEDGFVYTSLSSLQEYPLLEVSSSTRLTSVEHGATFTKIDTVEKKDLLAYSSLLRKINSVLFIVTKITVDGYGDVVFYDESGTHTVRFSRFSDTEKVWSTLLSAIDTEPLRSKLLNHKNDLVYIDVRFGNKVFYKFTNDEKTVIIQSHATTTNATSSVSH